MTFKKKMLAVAAAGALTATAAVPAMALENEFHGMFRAFGYVTNSLNGTANFLVNKDAKTNSFVEQRARLMYVAKANDDLKLVTHFELDSRWGSVTGAKYVTNDAGGLDADQVTLETKNVFLDFNCPLTGTNVKVGIQPFNDSYYGLFGNFDGTGLQATKKFGAFTPTFGYFRIADSGAATAAGLAGKLTTDLVVLDGKYAVNKNITVGGSYYGVMRDTGSAPAAELVHMLGLNGGGTFGPANVNAFFAYEFGDAKKSANEKLSAFALGAAAKIAVGPGKINAAAVYLSGDDNGTGDNKDFKALSNTGATSYFGPSNMWLLIRNNVTINSSAGLVGAAGNVGGGDLTAGGRGLIGLFAGYEGAAGKMFYNANLGYAQVDKKRTANSAVIGTEINGTVGYKLYDNLSASFTAAYAFLGDGMKKTTGTLLPGGKADADNPYLTNIQLNYTF